MIGFERRKYIRHQVKVPCIVQFSSGAVFDGITSDIGFDGALLDTVSFDENTHQISQGEEGHLYLKYHVGEVDNTAKFHCEVVHVSENGIGITLNFEALPIKDKEKLQFIIGSYINT